MRRVTWIKKERAQCVRTQDTDTTHEKSAISQTWCWAACLSMVDATRTQCQIATTYLDNGENCCDDPPPTSCEVTIPFDAVVNAWKSIGYEAHRKALCQDTATTSIPGIVLIGESDVPTVLADGVAELPVMAGGAVLGCQKVANNAGHFFLVAAILRCDGGLKDGIRYLVLDPNSANEESLVDLAGLLVYTDYTLTDLWGLEKETHGRLGPFRILRRFFRWRWWRP